MAEHHKKHKPRTIITHRHDDETYHHEHVHDDGKHAMFAGTSADLNDVKQHMDDHFGGEAVAEATPASGGDGDVPEN